MDRSCKQIAFRQVITDLTQPFLLKQTTDEDLCSFVRFRERIGKFNLRKRLSTVLKQSLTIFFSTCPRFLLLRRRINS